MAVRRSSVTSPLIEEAGLAPDEIPDTPYKPFENDPGDRSYEVSFEDGNGQNPNSLGNLPRVRLASFKSAHTPSVATMGKSTDSDDYSEHAVGPEHSWRQREAALYREGYLDRKEDGLMGRWQRRWCVVDGGSLKMYKDYDHYCKERHIEKIGEKERSRPMRLVRSKSRSKPLFVSADQVFDEKRRRTSLDVAADLDELARCHSNQELGVFDFAIRLSANKLLTLRASNPTEKQAWMHALQQGENVKAERAELAPLVDLLAKEGDGPQCFEHPILRIDDIYKMGELIGSGQTGKVYAATHRKSGEPVAVKVIDKSRFRARLSFQRRTAVREILVLTKCQMRHPHIVFMRAVIETSDWVYIVMELVEGGELQDKIEQRVCFSEGDAAEIIIRVVLTLGFLHNQGIVHRDIKPENILCSHGEFDIKLVDFGFANVSGVGVGLSHFRSAVGTPVYMAPEIADQRNAVGYTHKVDIWSAGMLLYHMLTGTLPFDGLAMDSEMAQRRRQLVVTALQEPEFNHISTEAKDLVRAMLNYNPDTRVDAAQIAAHPWIVARCAPQPELEKIMAESAAFRLEQV
jgi:tRNA A-37 threonylcarbamoyl transferase component Bud32